MKAITAILVLIISIGMVAAQSNSSQTQALTQLSNAHIMAIASGNLSAAENGYVQNPYVFVSMNFTNFSDTYYGQPGLNSAMTNMTSYGTPYSYYIRNTSIAAINSTAYSVNRDLWFVSKDQRYTLQIPYSAAYVYSSGSWYIYAEWFGLAGHAGTALIGNQAPQNQTTTVTTTANATTTAVQNNATTSLFYTIPGQNSTTGTTQNGQNSSFNLIFIVFVTLVAAVIVLYFLDLRKRA